MINEDDIQDERVNPSRFRKTRAAMLPCYRARCSSARAPPPGVAGGETLTAGITNYPLAYVKRPVPPRERGHRRARSHHVHHRQRFVRSQPGERGGAEVNVTQSITNARGGARLDVRRTAPSSCSPAHAAAPERSEHRPDAAELARLSIRRGDQTVTQLTNDDITAGHDVEPITCRTAGSCSPPRGSSPPRRSC